MAIEMLEELNAKWQQRYLGLARLQFSDWVPWRQRNAIHNVNKVGVYILAKYESNEVPQVDPLDEHIIYFGKTNVGSTTSLRNRLSAFNGAAFGNGAPHAGGYNYKGVFGTNQDGLYVSVCPVYWDDERINQLFDSKNHFDSYISGNSDDVQPFIIFKVITWLEVCLRGTYVYKWGRLPKCNKE